MAIRIQLRRDTAANWTSSNPVLRAGEFGVETDTLKFKIGNGSSTWTQIANYANVTDAGLSNSLNDYILAADQGTPGGPAELNSNGDLLIPEDSIILWDDAEYTYTTTLTATQPTEDRTITFPDATGTVALTSQLPSQYTDELAQDAAAAALAAGTHTNITVTYNDEANSISLAAAPGYVDEQAVDAVAAALAAGTHTNITVGYDDNANSISLTGAVTYTDENAQDAVGNAVGTGLSYNDTTGAISVNTSTIQARVTDVSDTEIGYLNGVTSAIQTQLDAKATTANASFTGTFSAPEGTITSTMIADGTIVDGDINASAAIAATKISGTAVTQADTGTVTSAMIANGAIVNEDINASAEIAQSKIANLTTDLGLKAPLADPTFTGTISAASLTISGDLTVNGTTTNINSTSLVVEDKNVVLGDVETPTDTTADGGGITLKGATDKTFNWVDATDAWTSSENFDLAATKTFKIAGTDVLTASQVLGKAVPSGTIVGTNDTQTLENKTLTSPKINENVALTATATELNYVDGVTSAIQTQLDAKFATANASTTNISEGSNLYFTDERAQDAVGNSVGTGLSYNDTTGAVSVDTNTIQARVTDVSDTEIGYLNGVTSAIQTQLNNKAPIESPTFTGTVAGITATMVGLGNVDNTSDANKPVSTATQTALDLKVDESLFDAKGDLLVGSADNVPAKLTVGTNGYLLTANSSATNGVEWAAAPVSLPSQSGESGKYLTTDGTTASWGTLVVPITTGTATVTANTATTVDTTALSAFTSIEYMVSLKQGSKIRTSKVVVQTDGTSVDMTEFAITETGGTIAGVVVSAAVSSTNGVLQVTATDATTTNVTVKFSKVVL